MALVFLIFLKVSFVNFYFIYFLYIFRSVMIKLKSIYLLMHYKDLMEMLLICNTYRLKEKKFY